MSKQSFEDRLRVWRETSLWAPDEPYAGGGNEEHAPGAPSFLSTLLDRVAHNGQAARQEYGSEVDEEPEYGWCMVFRPNDALGKVIKALRQPQGFLVGGHEIVGSSVPLLTSERAVDLKPLVEMSDADTEEEVALVLTTKMRRAMGYRAITVSNEWKLQRGMGEDGMDKLNFYLPKGFQTKSNISPDTLHPFVNELFKPVEGHPMPPSLRGVRNEQGALRVVPYVPISQNITLRQEPKLSKGKGRAYTILGKKYSRGDRPGATFIGLTQREM